MSLSVWAKTGSITGIPAYQVDAVDTTGAGDAFLGGLLYAYLHDLNIDETLTAAMTVSTLAILSEQTINPQMSESLLKETILQNI